MTGVSSRALIGLGALLALGMAAGAYVLGYQAKQIGGNRQSISVKGLAEKPVKADVAEWTVGVHVTGATRAEALQKSRAALPDLKQFLAAHGFDPNVMKDSPERVSEYSVEKQMPDGRVRSVPQGYQSSQDIVLTSPDLPKIETAYRAIVQFEAEGHPVTYEKPLYLVSNLEEVKMSLIGAATDNARVRAGEFAKHGGVEVGDMRTASQGSFYILPVGASTDADDYGYGGTYDKSTIDKIARVVVTIEYGIEH
ncbi:MAG TPA: SIMPL domain-containing protein [Steroidobacteraceae bacterium]|nr:SIMPL domain-containing protein [Steroidobacteraceae bacterium]